MSERLSALMSEGRLDSALSRLLANAERIEREHESYTWGAPKVAAPKTWGRGHPRREPFNAAPFIHEMLDHFEGVVTSTGRDVTRKAPESAQESCPGRRQPPAAAALPALPPPPVEELSEPRG